MSDNPTGKRPYDWSRLVKRINVRAEEKKVYAALTTPHGLEKWFLRKAIFTDRQGQLRNPLHSVEVGDQYEWYWHGYGDQTVEKGTILENNKADRVGFTFGKAGVVSISLKQEEGELIIELTQEGIPTDEENKVNFHLGCSTGWVFYLTNLKSIAQGGIDLRNKSLSLKHMINS
jgi:uncharacterized protein YndB with AHSA1/START domain